MKLSDLSTRQIDRARVIFYAALPFGADAVAAALMTAAAESSFLLYANDGTTKRSDVPAQARQVARESLSYEYDRVAPNLPASTPAGTWDTTADSVGHFQQRPMYGYGTVADLMDPAESTRIFIRGSKGGRTRFFLESPETLSLPQRCQWTQGSEFPTGENYAPMAPVAAQLVALFSAESRKDWLDMASKEEVQAAFQDATKGIDENAGEARRQGAVLLGARSPATNVGEKSIGDQVLDAKPVKDGHPVRTLLSDGNDRIVRIEASVKRIEALLAVIAAKVGATPPNQ